MYLWTNFKKNRYDDLEIFSKKLFDILRISRRIEKMYKCGMINDLTIYDFNK